MARLKAVRQEQPRPPDLRQALAEALKGMTWLQGSDSAIRALAERAADEIEKTAERAEELRDLQRESGGSADIYKRLQRLEAMCDVTKVVGWLGPQLQGYLKELGGTPAARKAMQQDKPIGGRLAQIRRDAGVDDS